MKSEELNSLMAINSSLFIIYTTIGFFTLYRLYD